MVKNFERLDSLGGYELSKAWTVDITDSCNAKITPPSSHSFEVISGSIIWSRAYDNPTASDLLWLHSLHFLPHFASKGMLLMSENLALDYLSRSEAGEFDEHRSRLRSSWDHATAMRLESITILLAMLDSGQTSPLYRLLDADLEWALDSSHMEMNNHGLMLCMALLQAANGLHESDPSRSVRIEQYAADSITFILRMVFGNDGYCNENSPFYAHFYVLKLKQLKLEYAQQLDRAGLASLIDSALETALRTLGNVILPDGYIPALGDSSYMESPYDSHLGTFISQRTGFWVHKTSALYVSLKSGSDSAVHKHADDSSITLQFEGQDFFVDSGYHSYDYSDPRVAMLRTQRGHSGIFFTEIDDCLPGLLYNFRQRVHAGIASGKSEETASVSSHYSLDCEHSAQRRLEVVNDSRLRITDTAYSALGWHPVQRFIVPVEAEIEVLTGRIVITREDCRLTMVLAYEHSAEVFCSEDKAPFRGWRSSDPLRLLAAQCLEITPVRSNTPWVMDIHLDRRN